MDAIRELKTRAEILHRRMQAADPASNVRRADCLRKVAAELGFPSWTAARRALAGEGVEDFGTLLYPRRAGGFLNLWYKDYDEASAIRAAKGGYLLAYQRHFLVVDEDFVDALGLDPGDPEWTAMGFDWVRPRDPAARARLYGQLVRALPQVNLSQG